ncbi:MAG: hypothetical protein M0R50_05875 [Candidatus Cloacimonetes bacterium]|jgi:hypothetical protein|nr:hypothetical protein [Candidatus Cloacimonadota bacterium]
MAKYCDTQVLERNWFEWLVSSNTPGIEFLRKKGMLWTLIIGMIPGTKIQDPCYGTRMHYIVPDDIIFCTCDDRISWVVRGNFTTDQLKEQGYYLEPPMAQSWQNMLEDIAKMCNGVASKFNQPSIEETNNLASEALVQVISKIARGKLRYTPGRAPVFNLLTTTIHRCIYSVLSKDARQKKNFMAFADNLVIEDANAVRVNYNRAGLKGRVNIDH